jgi:hypothetical protein
MAFTQLDPPIPLDVIDKGKGLAIGMIDYGPEHNLIWVTAIDATGEIWCAPNPKVRMQQNWTLGRSKPVCGSDTRPENGDLRVVNQR